jgi:hypothetical protein
MERNASILPFLATLKSPNVNQVPLPMRLVTLSLGVMLQLWQNTSWLLCRTTSPFLVNLRENDGSARRFAGHYAEVNRQRNS